MKFAANLNLKGHQFLLLTLYSNYAFVDIHVIVTLASRAIIIIRVWMHK